MLVSSACIKQRLLNIERMLTVLPRALSWALKASLILQDTEQVNVQYLMSLLFDLFEILQAVRSELTNFA